MARKRSDLYLSANALVAYIKDYIPPFVIVNIKNLALIEVVLTPNGLAAFDKGFLNGGQVYMISDVSRDGEGTAAFMQSLLTDASIHAFRLNLIKFSPVPNDFQVVMDNAAITRLCKKMLTPNGHAIINELELNLEAITSPTQWDEILQTINATVAEAAMDKQLTTFNHP